MNLLNISIITYNDLDNLKKQLDLLASITLPSDVKILIYDNYSDYDIFYELSCYKNIEIHRHQKNIGGNENIFYAYKYSKSKWTWVLSTNDFINPKLLIDLIDNLRGINSLALFMHSNKNGELFKINNLKYFQSRYERLFHISFIIVNTSSIQNKFHLYDKYIVTNQAQFFFLLELFMEKRDDSRSFYFNKLNMFSYTSNPEWNKLHFLNSNLKITDILSKNQFKSIKEQYGNYFLRTYLFIIFLGYKDETLPPQNNLLKKYFKVYFNLAINSYRLIYPLLLILKIKLKIILLKRFIRKP